MVALIPFAVAVGRADLRLDMEEAKGQLGADAAPHGLNVTANRLACECPTRARP